MQQHDAVTGPLPLPPMPPDLRTKEGLLAAKAQVGARSQHVEPGAKAQRRAKGKAAKAARRRSR